MKFKKMHILQYHNICKNAQQNEDWVTPFAFRTQMSYLAENNYSVLSLDEAVKYMEKGSQEIYENPISLTFDNGFSTIYSEVFPVLHELQLPAVVFISPNNIGHIKTITNEHISFLTLDALRKMAACNMTIGVYEDDKRNVNHVQEDVLKKHIVDYKKKLEDILGTEIKYFAVREGIPNNHIKEFLKSEGYKAFFTQSPTNKRNDLFSIGRIQIDDEDFNIFSIKISKTYLSFKDRRSWKYIRKYKLDRVVHRISEAYNRIKEASSSKKSRGE